MAASHVTDPPAFAWRVEWDSAQDGGWTVFTRAGDRIVRHSKHDSRSLADATAARLNAGLADALAEIADDRSTSDPVCECGGPLDRFGRCVSATEAIERRVGFSVKVEPARPAHPAIASLAKTLTGRGAAGYVDLAAELAETRGALAQALRIGETLQARIDAALSFIDSPVRVGHAATLRAILDGTNGEAR